MSAVRRIRISCERPLLICYSLETILRNHDFNGFVIQPATYRPFRFAVAVALLLSMAMPLVTYACDLTGLIETPLTMADQAGDAESSESDCPRQDVCGSIAADCASVVNCHGESFDTDACCSSQPELKDAVVSASKQLVQLHASFAGIVLNKPVQVPDDSPIEAPGQERAPPLETPIHILHSSLLL